MKRNSEGTLKMGTTPPPPNSVGLILLKQTSLCEDISTKHGTPKTIHTVVKNSPFTLTFGFLGNQPTNSSILTSTTLNLHSCHLDVKLLYDGDLEKEVDFVKAIPLQHKITLNQMGTKLTLEARIKVLTSHMENSLFRVGLFGYDLQKKTQLLFTVYSDAVKVISKSDQVKKKKKNSKKKLVNDMLTDQLVKIEEKQQEQVKLLEALENGQRLYLSEFKLPIPQSAPDQFQTAFKNLIRSYTQLNRQERSAKIQKIAPTVASSNNNSFVELMDLFWAEGLQREIGGRDASSLQSTSSGKQPDHSSLTVCGCSDCPYKNELSRIENFYEDIFATSLNHTAAPNVTSQLPSFMFGQ
eukprot:TRINITY_DN1553_c0_g1_i1.p1 TRINITY_DN1553_c0_g1~~TRINITY_DN1553_c0_g1_i1.p1  ORF type:complete len:354 (+),score=87.13 TRINITY_DN1553_c0_g1_i1:360-1421(+)